MAVETPVFLLKGLAFALALGIIPYLTGRGVLFLINYLNVEVKNEQ